MKKVLLTAVACLGTAWHIGLLDGGDKVALDAPRHAITVGNIYPGSADVIVRNTSGRHVASVFAHCTFRAANGSRIESVPVFVADLAPGDTATALARMPNDIRAASVTCS